MTRSRDPAVRRLMLFFAVAYTVEGIGQAKGGVIWQPLTYYLKQVHGWSPVAIAASLSVLDVPWVINHCVRSASSGDNAACIRA